MMYLGSFIFIIGVINILSATIFSGAIARFEQRLISQMENIWPRWYFKAAVASQRTRRGWQLGAGIVLCGLGLFLMAVPSALP